MSKLISKAEFLMNRERAKQLYSVSQIQKSYKIFLKNRLKKSRRLGITGRYTAFKGERQGGIQPNKLYDSIAATVGGGVDVENKHRSECCPMSLLIVR